MATSGRRGDKNLFTYKAKSFVLTGTPVDEDDPNSVLHWRVYVVHSEQVTVILDMIPIGGGGNPAYLDMQAVEKNDSSSSVAAISFDCLADVKIEDIVGKLIQLGRDRYKFTDDGSGCRWWCQAVLADLVQLNYVQEDAYQIFEAFISQRNAANPSIYPLPTRKGTFY